MEVIGQVPKTALDVFRLLPEGTLCEVIDNVLYMSPAPNYDHQSLVFLLAKRIDKHVEGLDLGEVIVSPFDVYLDDLLSAIQPDLLFLSKDNRHLLKEDGYIHGAPDLIVEVLSSDKKRDTVTKKSLYERAGVKEYFIVNPASRQVVCYTNIDGQFAKIYEGDGVFRSALLQLDFNF